MDDQEERRYAPDGGYYTYQEFYDYYGREDEWHNAGTATSEGRYDAGPAAQPQRAVQGSESESSSEEDSSSGSDIDSEEEE